MDVERFKKPFLKIFTKSSALFHSNKSGTQPNDNKTPNGKKLNDSGMRESEIIVELVLQSLNAIKGTCMNESIVESQPGIIDNLSRTIFLVQKIRQSREPTKIGFFGAQKRGKSSLINELLRCEIMPTAIAPMSSAVIEVRKDVSSPPEKFKIDIFREDGSREPAQVVGLKDAKMILEQYGSRKGGDHADTINLIRVSSSFPESKILENGGILVDTPGAEVAFDQDKDNSRDTKRALAVLSKTHIVLFIERADYIGGANGNKFVKDHLSLYRPLGVISMKDRYGKGNRDYEKLNPDEREQKKEQNMRKSVMGKYDMNPDRLLCVSSKEFSTARKNNNTQMLKSSNIPALEDRILLELGNLNSEKGLITCLEELRETLQQIRDIDNALVQRVFEDAQRPFYVLSQKLKNSNSQIKRLVMEIYEGFKE